MLLDLNTIETIGQADLEDLQSKLLYRKFGQENDSIELTIRDINGNVVINDEQFTDYTAYYNGGDQGNLVDSIDVDYIQVLKDYGFENGKYKLTFSFQRKLLVNTFERPFYISEISPSRTEIRFASSILAEDTFNNALQNLIANVNNASFVKDVNISFSSGETGLVVNTQIDTDSGLIKLYDPLTVNISVNSSFRIYEEIINPLEATIDLGPSTSEDTGVELRAPNFDIQFSQEYTVPSKFRTYDDILNQGAVTSSFQNIQNYFSGSIPIDLEFDNPNTPSGYTFENFIHFSSATERLKNFKYKLELLESYSGSLATLSNITGSISESSPTTQNISIFRNKRDKLIGGFDYYERYLYYESGTYAWPKINIGKPYTNAKVNSAAATSWFGAPIDDDQNEFYGGQMLSASKFDSCNPYNLINTIPPDIQNNSQNEGYILFTEMIAQHFDGIWAYIDSITDKPQAYSGLNDGISKELVFNALAEKGIRGYSQFENSSIYEYLIGDDGSGTFQYQSPDTFSTMVSASNAGSIPKGDISKEIWKRLYHNTPYLLKTKGTERGLKALIACYGIPETVLHVKEYGGPLQDKTGFRTFSYQKESKMLSSIDVNSADHPMLSLNEFGAGFLPNTKTIQVRFLPTKGTNTTYDIITLIDPDPDIAGVTGGVHDIAIGISQSIDTSKVNSGSFAHLVIASGSSDDNGINFGITGKASSNLGPIFNGEVWNLSVRLNSGSDEGNTIEAFATNTTPNKNTYVLSCSLDATEFFRIPNPGLADLDETEVMVGNTRNVNRKPLLGGFTGSIQEYRGWTEKLTEATIVTQSLSPFNYNGNTISSSFEALYIRIPLGSTLTLNSQQATENHAPNSAFHIYKGFQYAFNSNPTFIEETHHLPTPDTVGSGMVSDKVRIDNGTFDDNFLDPFISVETSPQDRQPLDFSDVGVFFSPTFEVNEDIIYTLGGFRLDDYIGDPTYYTSASYPALKDLKDIYTQKLDKKLGIGDYIRTIQFFDHTLFKMIKDFVPAKANLKTGLVIEPHYLERVKVPGKNVDYEQKPEHLFHVQSSASLVGSENINETNIVIDVEEYLTQGTEGTATENVAQVGKKSKFYILR
jgi:hypothetical protein